MDGGNFDIELAKFELDQARRRREAAAVEQARPPLSAPAAAWIPLFLWLTLSVTALIHFAQIG